jgi:hypothetical protein
MRAIRIRTQLPGLALFGVTVAAALLTLTISRALVGFDGWPADPVVDRPGQLAIPGRGEAPGPTTRRPASLPGRAAAPAVERAPSGRASASGATPGTPAVARVTTQAPASPASSAPEAARPLPRDPPTPPPAARAPAAPAAAPASGAELLRTTANSVQATLRAAAAAVGDLLPGR